MLRKKPSIRRLNFIISSSISQVTSFSSPFPSKDLRLALKPSTWIHHRYRSFTTATQRSDVFPDPSPDGSHPRNPLESDGRTPGSFQQNSNGFYGGSSPGYQISDLGGVRQVNPNGFYGGNSSGYQRSDLGEVRQVNPNGFYGGNSSGYQRCDLGEIQRPNSNGFHGANSGWDQRRNLCSNGFHAEISYGHEKSDDLGMGSVEKNSQQVYSEGFYGENPVGYQRSELGEVRPSNSFAFHGDNTVGHQRSDSREAVQQKSDGFYRGNSSVDQQSDVGEIHGSSSDGVRMTNGGAVHHNANWHSGGNTGEGHLSVPIQAYNQNPGNNGEFYPNSNNNDYSDFHGAGSGEPYQNPTSFNQENHREFQNFPYGQHEVNSGKLHENYSGYNKEQPLLWQDAFPSGESAQTDEICSYKGTLSEFDEFTNNGKVKKAVEVLTLLEKNGVVIDHARYLKLVQACGDAKSTEEGKIVHDRILQAMGEVGIGVHNKILDMYCKCGSMDDAFQLFDKMPQRNLTSWDTMITGLANNNLGEAAVDLFLEFKELGLRPDADIFVAVFRACGVLGSVEEGMLHFDSMKVDFGIAPTMKHYVSIVDMHGRSGYLDEALEFIENMPVEPSVDVWETLMNLCRVNGYEDLGDRCAGIVDKLDPSRLTEESRKGLLIVKATSNVNTESANKSNMLRGKSQIHEYRAGDRSNPEIYAQINILAPHMKEAGYVPDIKCVLHDVDEESREEALLYHSERLATAYGLLTSSARSPIRIIKNLRVCRDCHNAMKIMSKIVGRKLIARDAKRFHHFEDGVCSCKDFW